MVTPFQQDTDYWKHDIVALLQDGRVIAMGKARGYQTMYGSGVSASVNVRIPDLREIEYILNIELYTNPTTHFLEGAAPIDKKITGNVVGFTIYGNAVATSITAEVIAVGV